MVPSASKRDITIRTPDGVARASMFRTGQVKAGVVLYMDAFGPRPALYDMAARLSGHGYAVLVPDLFYRNTPYGPFDAKTAFAEEKSKAALTALISGTTQDMTARDSGAFITALETEGVRGAIGVVGYCMGGGRALNAAAAYPDKIAAAASFHGGRLGTDAPDSPTSNAAKIKARVYVGSAGVDGSFPPEQSARLARALREAEVDHVIENYVGMQHGWCVSDHSVFDIAGAERHWKRLIDFFGETLG
ncbi:dienelactone hydrolase family protein [Mesorhizobium sp. 1M-11]|uniref:dienelactone hydrolase family protein n=1 Tax=Mesorhizobium sp. 1M-11 TaxID=1529006 RepID=UPI0006C75856|nr:dienelactone hydrolase family protein [Mesorhizobium sp. 1M-11]